MNGILPGLRCFPGFLDRSRQEELVEVLRQALAVAPFFTPVMPRSGKPFSVRMSNLGPLGWVSDRQGYRYQTFHPDTRKPWPPLPAVLLDLWHEVSDYDLPPEACLVNLYRGGARMGLHQDADEADLLAPVVSVSLGDTAVFRIGGSSRQDPTKSLKLSSGDVLVMGGPARFAFHGIDRICEGTSTILKGGGRINLTLRRVSPRPENDS